MSAASTSQGMPKRCLFLVVAALICGLAPVGARASEVVKLHTAFKPNRLGASTTVEFGFSITNTTGGPPPAVTNVNLHLPAGMNENASELGLAVCDPAALLALGPKGCPANSQVGSGTAFVEVTLGETKVQETVSVTTFNGPPKTSSEVLFFADGKSPVEAELVFPGILREESGVFSGALETTVPLVPSVPDGPYVSMTRFSSTLGPLGITYYKRIHGRRRGFHPKGILVPTTCPKHGFPFVVELRFIDGTKASGSSKVPCPRKG